MTETDLPSLYREISFGAALHVMVRQKLFPYRALIPYLPDSGRFLDLGCGHGHWAFVMASLRADAEVIGIDPDHRKILIANQVLARSAYKNIQFGVLGAEDYAVSNCDVISLIDVLYLVPYAQQEEILATAASGLRENGVLLLKTMDTKPRWKFALNLIEETLAVRLLGLTTGREFYFRRREEWLKLLEVMGFSIDVRYIGSGYLHPHLLFVARKQ